MLFSSKNALVVLVLMSLLSCSKSHKTLLFVGSFTDKNNDRGIHVYEFDERTGASLLIDSVADISDPSFLKITPDGAHLYAASGSKNATLGAIVAFHIDSLSGKLNQLNSQVVSSREPVHITIDTTGRFVICSNYSDSSIGVLECSTDGNLHTLKQQIRFTEEKRTAGRQDASHIHSANFTPDGAYIVAQDLGADKMRIFKFHPTDTLPLEPDFDLQIQLQPQSGPRHFIFHPNGKFGYGIAELNGMITAYGYHKGQFSFLENYLSYSKEQETYRAADIHISPDGKFLYTSNRGPEEDTIAIFGIDQNTGFLTLIGHKPTAGKHPRNFAIDPSGNFLLVANQFTNNIVIFKRNQRTGMLTKLNHTINVSNPACLQMRTYAYND